MGRGAQQLLDIASANSGPVLPDAGHNLVDDPVFAPFAQETFDANEFASSALAGSHDTAQVCRFCKGLRRRLLLVLIIYCTTSPCC